MPWWSNAIDVALLSECQLLAFFLTVSPSANRGKTPIPSPQSEGSDSLCLSLGLDICRCWWFSSLWPLLTEFSPLCARTAGHCLAYYVVSGSTLNTKVLATCSAHVWQHVAHMYLPRHLAACLSSSRDPAIWVSWVPVQRAF